MSKIYSAVVLLALSFACKTAPIPKWDGEIYTGDPVKEAMVREQAGEVIKANSPEFKQLMGMKWKGPRGFEGFYQTYILGCKEWKSGVQMIPFEDAVKMLSEAMPDDRTDH